MSVQRLTLTLEEAAEVTGLSQDLIRAAALEGRLRGKRTGKVNEKGRGTGRYLFRVADLEEWFDSLEDAEDLG